MNAIGDALAKYFPNVSRRPKIGKREALSLIPVRNSLVEWERKDKDILLTVPMRQTALVKVVRRFARDLPEKRQVGLDEVGAAVWELCDGESTIDEVIRAISREYKLTRREAEASVTMFLQTLAKRNLVGLMSAGGREE